jgi:hypothetical protein
MPDGMPILPVEPVDGLPKGFRQDFGRIRHQNGRTFTQILTFAH